MELGLPTQNAEQEHLATAISATESTDDWKPSATVAEIATVAVASSNPNNEHQAFTARDEKGRFLTGNNGGGRPKGARNRLTEVFLSAIVDDFAKYGADAIARVRTADPVAYLKIVGAMVPPELILKRESEPTIDYAELTFEEAGALAELERRRQLIRRAIEG